MRGIVLAGGSGTRLRPLTGFTSKQLLPIYDKPMIYYPLSVLMEMDIGEILVICDPNHLDTYRAVLGDGAWLGLRVEYAVQPRPRGIAEALLIGGRFVGTEQICLILGDNIFHGPYLPDLLRAEAARLSGCTLFGYPVENPEQYGVATVDADGTILELVEKPAAPASNTAVTGLYLYDNEALEMAARLRPSARGELEITDLNQRFVARGEARLVNLERGCAWFDTGTHDSLLDAGVFVRTLQKRQSIRISCLEEIAYQRGFIGPSRLAAAAARLSPSTDYGRHVRALAEEQAERAGVA